MTTEEVTKLMVFLAGGLLAGTVGHWLDLLVAYIRKG